MVDAVVKDGQVVESASQSSVKKATKSKNGVDKDAFLQLLVAQMKYQDPLEPTSNTEFISQYAQFSQVEQMQNMAATMELTRASSMVGKLVTVESTNSSGETVKVQGYVEYVAYENGKAFISIDGSTYSLDDVIAVVDETYQTAYDLAVSFVDAVGKLPIPEELNLKDHQERIETLQKAFNNMTAYQQSFIPDETIEKLKKCVEKIAELKAAEDADKPPEGDKDETEGADGSGDGDKTDEGVSDGKTTIE